MHSFLTGEFCGTFENDTKILRNSKYANRSPPVLCGGDKSPTPSRKDFLLEHGKRQRKSTYAVRPYLPDILPQQPSALGQCGICPRDLVSWRRKCSMNKAVLSNGYCEHVATTRQPARKLIAVLYAQWPFIGLLLCGKWKSPCICCSGLFG